MRIPVVALGFSLLIHTALAAQATEKLTVTPAAPFRPRLDFGLEQAEKKLPLGPWKLVQARPQHALPMQPSFQAELMPPIDCKMVKTHRHELLSPTMRIVEPSPIPKHHLKTVPVTPCPVR